MEKWDSADTESGGALRNSFHHALVPTPPPAGSSSPPNAHRVLANSCGSRDPNLAKPRLHLNRTCIYERHLPGDAYITAHVSRLQHGFYSSPAVSEQDFDHVDFLAVDFVFHAPHTLTHPFKAATILNISSKCTPGQRKGHRQCNSCAFDSNSGRNRNCIVFGTDVLQRALSTSSTIFETCTASDLRSCIARNSAVDLQPCWISRHLGSATERQPGTVRQHER